MKEITLTDEESTLLVQILEDYISDIRMEIADTDKSSFKEKLKTQKLSVIKILNQFKENTDKPA